MHAKCMHRSRMYNIVDATTIANAPPRPTPPLAPLPGNIAPRSSSRPDPPRPPPPLAPLPTPLGTGSLLGEYTFLLFSLCATFTPLAPRLSPPILGVLASSATPSAPPCLSSYSSPPLPPRGAILPCLNFDRRQSRPQIAPDRARSRRSPRHRKIATRSQDRLRSPKITTKSPRDRKIAPTSPHATTSTLEPT